MTTAPNTVPLSEPIDDVRATVRARYAAAALAAVAAPETPGRSNALESCCGDDGRVLFGSLLYALEDRRTLPDAALLASLGCGVPLAVAELQPGETVLDLGSGGGIDVLLSARRVGESGLAIGVDMTDEMLDLAAANAREAGVANVEFRKGTIEALPIGDAEVDVIISNCVINLAADKGAVFAEIARVLRPGGRMGVSDIVADDSLSPAERAERGSYVGCIAGALSYTEFRDGLAAAGLVNVAIEPTHEVAEGLQSAIIRATKPAAWAGVDRERLASALPSQRATRDLDGDANGCGCGGENCC